MGPVSGEVGMAESKVQKVARGKKTMTTYGTCHCGGDIRWVKLFAPRGRMVKQCEKCGTWGEKEVR